MVPPSQINTEFRNGGEFLLAQNYAIRAHDQEKKSLHSLVTREATDTVDQ